MDKALKIVAFLNVLFLFTIFTTVNSQNIPIFFRTTVVFLSNPDEYGESHNIGTGFFVSVPDSNLTYGYLVTAKHIINPEGKISLTSLQISFNTKHQKRDSLLLKLYPFGPKRNIFYHRDASVDLVVIPLAIGGDNADVGYCFINQLFKSKIDFDTSYIKPGTNIFYTGMFSPYIGYEKNYPITRFGKVSLITDEKIQFEKSGLKANLIMAETTTFGGNSGSPVFAYGSEYKINSHDSTDAINTKEQNNVPIYLMGIMKGYFQENNPIKFVNTSAMTPTSTNNIGVAAIIPSYLLFDIIESSELQAFREKYKLYNK